MEKQPNKTFTEVWGDTVILKELFASAIIGIIVTMGAYLISRHFFINMPNVTPAVGRGYALMVGIAGCVLSGIISAKFFKPKREFFESQSEEKLEHILQDAGMTIEEEALALATIEPEIIAEMEELELYGLLALIPEGTPNYKPIYKEKSHQKTSNT